MKFLTRTDVLFVAALAALTAVYWGLLFDFARAPFEDAAMLMRYAVHVSQGHGVVWNVGEAPVDGATDFLFMALVAGLAKAGVGPEAATRGLGFVSHALTVLLVYAGIVRYAGGHRWLAFFSAAFVALGPGLRYVEAYFGTPFFACLGTLTWFLALAIMVGTPTRTLSLGFALAAFATGLARPEGVFLSIIILVAIVYAKGWRASAATVAGFLVVFAVGGGSYLAWRKIYFGYWLPNPFYAKGGGELHASVLVQSVWNVVTLLLPLLPAFMLAAVASVATLVKTALMIRLLRPAALAMLALFALGLLRTSHPGHQLLVLGRYSPAYALVLGAWLGGACAALGVDAWVRRRHLSRVAGGPGLGTTFVLHGPSLRRWTVIALIPLLGFTAIWLMIQDFMNYLMRFQYALMPIAFMAWPLPFAHGLESSRTLPSITRRRRLTALVLGAAVLMASIAWQRSLMVVRGRFHDGRIDMALMLHEYASRGYTMATTEAGLLPYYSEWDAIDVYGYNDRWIAHHGLSEEYLDRRHPELIVVAGTFPLQGGRPAIEVLKHYVARNDYLLAAAYGGDRHKVHYYYVRRGFADANVLVTRIRSLDYVWYMSDEPAIDFAGE